MGYVTIYNEDEARSKQEQSCRKWVDAFQPYVEVGAGSPKYLVVGVTVNEDEITKRATLLEEAKILWQSYERGGEFPHGKSRELLALEGQMQQRLAEMPETVHLASDRQTDSSWGSLYGHIMWSDWMGEKNVNEDPPSP